ncbi:avidin/streptavidin family protein [Legionella waltersii]|uniref:Avidin family protein n=1 Tax=Legionella waltersii TaxID=66969 RepID=A0A0W0ZZS6_9GAMM|nr:avidin/streptavidin family protein [Legionella waltersii]KTD74613.1 Avidin family protein [Legionella waltersii]SNV08806.1 Avidin family [Legionella waltersii]
MKLNLLSTALIATALVCQPALSAQKTLTFKNQRGSTLEINVLADNKIEGYFTTAVASKSCPQAINTKRPITGYWVGNAISFSVVYPMCESVLSISGNFDKDQKAIDTVSILNKQSVDITHEGPGARFIGHDSYTIS